MANEEAARQQRESDASATDLSLRRRQQRYAIGVRDYICDLWCVTIILLFSSFLLIHQLTASVPGCLDHRNGIDVLSLGVVSITIARWLLHSATATNVDFAAVGTSLLWVRVIQYLNGLDATAAYGTNRHCMNETMTLSVTCLPCV